MNSSAKIVIIGAGRIGLACAKIIQHINLAEVTLVDTSQVALDRAVGFQTRLYTEQTGLRPCLVNLNPDLVICCTPFTVNVQVAQLAAELGYHYLDFTEDTGVTSKIEALSVETTFVPQTGLAPGLVSYIGLSLFERLGTPEKLLLRVGALPQVSLGPDHYLITWSPEGLINEYLRPAVRKVNDIIEEVPALSDEETLMIHGTRYEAFTTSGGVGSLSAYDSIPNVEYKTLRYPGHLNFIQKLFAQTDSEFQLSVDTAKLLFKQTRDDLIVLAVHAEDTSGMSASRGITFYPNSELDLTAIELTTAGTGVAVAELILSGALPTGILNANDIPLTLLRTTAAYLLIFRAAR